MVLDSEVEPEELAEPLVLGDRGQPLIEQVLQDVMVGVDQEAAATEVRPPMSYGLDQANELPFVCH